MVSQAETPICGGNHSWWPIRSVPSITIGSVYSHTHNGHLCWIETKQDRILMKCACEREEVFDDGYPYLVHHIDYSH